MKWVGQVKGELERFFVSRNEHKSEQRPRGGSKQCYGKHTGKTFELSQRRYLKILVMRALMSRTRERLIPISKKLK